MHQQLQCSFLKATRRPLFLNLAKHLASNEKSINKRDGVQHWGCKEELDLSFNSANLQQKT